jgi:NitT/TauT family transport system ATP-binding protein
MPTMSTETPPTTVATDAVPRLKMQGIGRDFVTRSGVTHAVAGVDLSIQRGEFVALIGRSGCGKTTLLRMIGGLLAPSAGTIEVDGNNLWRGSQVDESAITKLGFVFQESNLFPWLSVLDNIALPMKLRGASKTDRRARAAELCALVGLTGFEKSYPRELSGGMRQRAAIARALIVEPDVLLMDEPLSALDARMRDVIIGDLCKVWLRRGFSAIYVTHDPAEVVRLSHRVMVLSDRPGAVRDEIEIQVRLPDRSDEHPELVRAREWLRSLLREDEPYGREKARGARKFVEPSLS